MEMECSVLRANEKILCIWSPQKGTLQWVGSTSCQKIEGSPSLLLLPARIFIDLDGAHIRSGEEHWIYSTLAVIQACPHLTFYWATSDPSMFHSVLSDCTYTNLWVGAKIQEASNLRGRIRSLFQIGISKCFVICDHITQPLSLINWLKSIPQFNARKLADDCLDEMPAIPGIDEVWIIPARGNYEWEQRIERECEAAGIPCRIVSYLSSQSMLTKSKEVIP